MRLVLMIGFVLLLASCTGEQRTVTRELVRDLDDAVQGEAPVEDAEEEEVLEEPPPPEEQVEDLPDRVEPTEDENGELICPDRYVLAYLDAIVCVLEGSDGGSSSGGGSSPSGTSSSGGNGNGRSTPSPPPPQVAQDRTSIPPVTQGQSSMCAWPGQCTVEVYNESPDYQGGSDDDNICGFSGHNVLRGGAGCDLLFGSSGHDELYGEGDDDYLLGGQGNDVLDGGPGDDILDGSGGNDRFIGGQGDDEFRGGGGKDTADYSAATSTLYLRLADGWFIDQFADRDTFTSIENIIGGSGDDFISGNDQHNEIYGGPGDDNIEGNGGNDLIDGGTGQSFGRLNGGESTNDQDLLVVRTSADLTNMPSRHTNFEGFRLHEDAETSTVTTLTGDAEMNTLHGNDGPDILIGGAGNDILDGHGGKDRLKGGAGKDILVGGAGVDCFQFDVADSEQTSSTGKDEITDFETEDVIYFDPGTSGKTAVARAGKVIICTLSGGSCTDAEVTLVIVDPMTTSYTGFGDCPSQT